MTEILIYVAITLALFVIGYMVRVYELSSSIRGKKQHIVTEGDNRLMARFMLTFLFAFFAFVIYNLESYGPRTLPESASAHGVELDWLFNFNMIILFIVFTITQIFLFVFAFKYYGREGNKATYLAHNNKLEMIWTVIPAIVLAIIIIFGLKNWNKITEPASKEAIVIQLYAKQFDWTARYDGKDNELGASNYKLITGENPLGIDSTDIKSNDDIVVRNEFHIPLGKEVEFKLNAREVIHSAYMPHFRSQMNCVPGMTTMMHFTPIITTAQMREKLNNPKFDYILLCNKICGNSHYNMQMTIVVETESEYNAWLSSKSTFKKKAAAPAEVKAVAAK